MSRSVVVWAGEAGCGLALPRIGAERRELWLLMRNASEHCASNEIAAERDEHHQYAYSEYVVRQFSPKGTTQLDADKYRNQA